MSEHQPALPNGSSDVVRVVGRSFIFVPADKTFTFKGLCPYCKGDLTYHTEGWEQQDDGTWTANCLQSDCSTEPPIESDEWEDWFAGHSDMPYVYQLPVDQKVEKYINKRYRFVMK